MPKIKLLAIALILTSCIFSDDGDILEKGIINKLEGFEPDIYIIEPDTNQAMGFAVTGMPDHLPNDNLPDEFKEDSLRVHFEGEIVEVSDQERLPAPPMILHEIRKE
ncbi:MAG: hypothetical protein WD267_08140 [Balneolales bacterium]